MKITNEVFYEAYSFFVKEIFNIFYWYLKNKEDQ